MARRADEVRRIVRQTVRLLKQHIDVQKAYLFGSYVDGTATETSDIDIAIFSPSLAKLDLEKKMEILARVQMNIGAEVEIHLFPTKTLAHARPSNFVGYIVDHGKKIAA